MTKSKILVTIIGNLQTLIKNKQYTEIDAIIAIISILLSVLSPEIMICYIRTTFIIKSKLYNWDILLMNIKVELNRRNLNTEKILAGLLD